METKKMSIGLSLSRNFDKITLSFEEEPVEYESDEELKTEIQKRFSLLRAEIEKEFGNIQK